MARGVHGSAHSDPIYVGPKTMNVPEAGECIITDASPFIDCISRVPGKCRNHDQINRFADSVLGLHPAREVGE